MTLYWEEGFFFLQSFIVVKGMNKLPRLISTVVLHYDFALYQPVLYSKKIWSDVPGRSTVVIM